MDLRKPINLGVVFDKLYYESDTYQIGKEVVNNGLKNKIFYSKEDNSILQSFI